MANSVAIGRMIHRNVDRTLTLLGTAGTTYFVDANVSSSGSGDRWDTAFKTMSEAFDVIASGDVIRFRGKIREQLTAPVQVFDISIIGSGNRPRHADDEPDGGQNAANTWTIPSSGATTAPLLQVIQQGWRFVDILFAGPTDDACVSLLRNSDSGDDERDASHAEFHNCRFASGQDGIENDGGCYNVGIFDCSFHDLTGYAFKQGGASVADPYRWQIKRNRIDSCVNLFGAWNFKNSEIHDNIITDITTDLIDTSGGDGDNTFLRNSFDIAGADFDPAGGVTGKSGEVWSTYLTDGIESGLPTN